MNRRVDRPLSMILGLCLATRGLFFLLHRPWDPVVESQVILIADALGYHLLAKTLLACGRFALDCAASLEALRPPLYPGFLAFFYLLGGRPWVAILAQCGLEMVTCALLYVTLSRVLDRRVGLVAALFYALDPFACLFSTALLSEALYQCLLVTFFFWWQSAGDRKRGAIDGRRLTLAAFFLGLATLVRPVSQYLILLVAGEVFLRSTRAGLGAAARRGLVVILVFVGTLSPWLVRNFVAFGHPSLSTSGAFALLFLDVGPMVAEERQISYEAAKVALEQESAGRMIADGFDPTDDPFLQASYRRRLALDYIVASPLAFARTSVRGVVHTFGTLATNRFGRHFGLEVPAVPIKGPGGVSGMVGRFWSEKGVAGRAIALAVLPFLLVTYAGLAWGLVLGWRHHDRWRLGACLVVAAYFVVTTGAAGLVRYRLPVVPFYLPFTAIGVLAFRDRLGRPGAEPRRDDV